MKMFLYIVLPLLFFGLFYGLTQPEELREYRWLKICVSLAIVFVILPMINLFIAIFVFVGLCILWSPNISFFVTRPLMHLISSDGHVGRGITGSFGYARNCLRHGELEEALAATTAELEAQPKNYEGLMLLATIHQKLNQPGAALPHLDIILNNPDAAESQKEVARAEKQKCEELQKELSPATSLEAARQK